MLVSVVLPTFNRENTIRRALTSVLNQTGVEFEVIVVDDASTDSTPEILSTFSNDPRLRVIYNRTRLGGAGARNIGISEALGDYIAFQDSDDEWLFGKLEAQIRSIQDSGAEVSYCSFISINKFGSEIRPSRNMASSHLLQSLLKENFISTQTLTVKKSALTEVGMFDECLPKLQDWDLVLRLANIYRFTFVSAPMVIVYDTPGSLSNIRSNEIVARERILSKWQKNPVFDRKVSSWHSYILSRLFIEAGRNQEGARYAIHSIQANPLNVKAGLSLLQAALRYVLASVVRRFGSS